MTTSRIVISGLVAAMAFTPVTRAVASDLGSALVGGIIGGVIVNEVNKNRRVRTVRRSSVSSYTRAQNREVQTSLNYFNFPAGFADGALGRNSRRAIANYQAYLGYPATGYLNPYERDFLVSSYHRAIAGGPATTQLISQQQEGTRGVLIAYRNLLSGTPQAVAVAPAPTPAPAIPAIQSLVTEAAVSEDASTSMPSFMGQTASVSLASHCNTVSLLTNSNGGFVTEASMSDPSLVLNEQFCLARTYAIALGEDLASQVQGFSSAQIAKQCAAFGPVLKDYVAEISLKTQQEVLQNINGFVLNSGMSPPQLTGTAKICLSVGYRTDDMDVAIGSALVLVALGSPVYGELIGHHLTQGIGASARPDLGLSWYRSSLDALANGATPVFAPGQPERTALIRKAAFEGDTGGGAETLSVSLPNFGVEQKP
ncbi:MAG: peptidoglycan-binding domain-containing protein [Paracoccaceae bacterium]